MSHKNKSTLAVSDLDITFGSNGVVQLKDPVHPGELLLVMSIADDPTTDLEQRIYVAAGSVSSDITYIVRLLPDGGLDSAFGAGGYVAVPRGDPNSSETLFVNGFVFADSGKITCLGVVSDFTSLPPYELPAAIRLTRAGVIDSNFGEKGGLVVYRLPVPQSEIVREDITSSGKNESRQAIRALGIEALVGQIRNAGRATRLVDGKMLFVGTLAVAFAQDGFIASYLIRINNDGTLDSSFGENGLVLISYPATDPSAVVRCWHYDIDRQGGAIVVGERAGLGIVVRYDREGHADQDFGEGGGLRLLLPGYSTVVRSVKALDDGKAIILAALFPNNVARVQFPAVIKLLRNGERDPDFNNGEPATADFTPSSYAGVSMDVDDASRILIAGFFSREPAFGALALGCISRLMPRGMLDDQFGSGGTRVYEDPDGLFFLVTIQNGVNILTRVAGGYGSVARFIG